jgi:hypothetical protein
LLPSKAGLHKEEIYTDKLSSGGSKRLVLRFFFRDEMAKTIQNCHKKAAEITCSSTISPHRLPLNTDAKVEFT